MASHGHGVAGPPVAPPTPEVPTARARVASSDATTTLLGTVDIVALNPTLGSWVVVDFGDFGTSATEFTTGQGLYLSVIASGTGGGAGELRFSLIGLTYGF